MTREVIRAVLAILTGAAIFYLDTAFILSRIWVSQAHNMVVVPFEPLVICNLAFILMYVTLKE